MITLRTAAAAIAFLAFAPAALAANPPALPAPAANPPALQLPGANSQPQADRPQLNIHQPQQPTGEDVAVAACVDFTPGGAEAIATANDGLDDFTVWLVDASQEHMYLCNADEEGYVYAHVEVDQDLLGGEGAAYLPVGGTPASAAQWICQAVSDDGTEVLATAEDGLPSDDGESFYMVWLQQTNGDLIMCDASAHGEIFAYETVNYALNQPAADPGPSLPTT
jgi:hypothetical protein